MSTILYEKMCCQVFLQNDPTGTACFGTGRKVASDDAGATPTRVGGSDTFNVGATLHVGATQAAGTYSGTVAVTVSYN